MARELKYNTHFTDLDALQRELGTSSPGASGSGREPDSVDDEDDEYEDWTGTER